MSNDNTTTHPYTLEVTSSPKRVGNFEWVIRKNGKLVERSDRLYPTERAARENAEAALERQLRGER